MTRALPDVRVRLVLLALAALALLLLPAPPAGAAGSTEPGTLVVQTVPPVPGARVSADGAMVKADDEGIARLPVRHFERLEERFNAPQTRVAKDRRVEFDRIRGQMHNAFDGRVIEVGLRTERLVRWRFVDRGSAPVSPERLSEVVLRSTTGEQVKLTGEGISKPRWLAASRTQQTSNGLMSKDIAWTVQSVRMDGAELVNRSQQRFVPDQGTDWTIALLFYRAKVRAADILFGTPTGQGVQVTGPDGAVSRYPMDSDGFVTLPAVPRGEYKMTVYGSGVSFSRPVTVSKDQDVELLVISRLDLVLIGGTLLLVALGLVLIGRRRRLSSWAADRRGRGADEPVDAGPVDVLAAEGPAIEGASPTGGRRLDAILGIALLAVLALWVTPADRAQASALGGSVPVQAAQAAVGQGTQAAVGPAAESPSPERVPVLAYYYIWFNPTSWNRAKIDYPLQGRYSSDDEVVMARHIDEAQGAGIDGFLVSWKRTPQLNDRLEKLAEVATAKNFKLGIVYQGLDFEREPVPAAQVAEDLTWFASTYARQGSFHVLDDKPLVVWTGTGRFSTDDVAGVASQVSGALHVLASAKQVADYQRVAQFVDGNAYYWSSVRPETKGYASKLQAMSDAVHAEGGIWVAPFAPGFDARLVGGTSAVPRNNGETLRKELAAAQSSDPDVLGLISWNEFSENTHVEPSEEYGTSALRTLALSLGATPPPAAADSSDTDEAHAGVTGWGALVMFGLLLGLLNLIILLRGRNRSRTNPGGRGPRTEPVT